MEDIIDIIVTETTNTIEITAQPNDEIIDVNIIDNREDIVLNVTPTVVEININSLTSNFGVAWGDITGTLADQTDLNTVLTAKANLVDGKVPSSELPSYVDDVVEVANYAALPATGEVGKIYIILDTNKIYRWSGSVYVEIADSSAVWGAITGTLSSQTDLQNALNLKANDNAVVHLAGSETITGTKTFEQAPLMDIGVGYKNGSGVYNYLKSINTGWEMPVNGQNHNLIFSTITNYVYTFPNASGTIALLTDIPSLSGYVPYTGATANVNLGNNDVTAGSFTGGTGSFATSGAGNSVAINHSSGSGIALSITKSGSGEGIYVNKSSGSGNAVTIVGTLNATTLVKSGGTSSQFLKADGSVDSSVYLTTSSASSTYLTLSGGTLTGGLNGTFGNFSSYVNAQTINISNSTASNALRVTHTNGTFHAVTITATGGSALYATGTVTVIGTGTFTGVLTAQSGLSNGAGQSFALPSSTGTLALTSQLSSYLPLAGGTLTGALSGTSATFSSTVQTPFLAVTQSGSQIASFDSTNANGGYMTWGTSGNTIADIGTAQQIFGSGGSTTFGINARGARSLIFGTNNTARFTLDSTGAATFSASVTVGEDLTLTNVGTAASNILATSTSGLLSLTAGASSGYTGGGTIELVANDRSGTNTRGEVYISGGNASANTANGFIALQTANTERLRVTYSGNVGIGTTTPTTYSLAGRHLELNDAGGGYSFFHNNTTSVKSFFATNESAGLSALFTFSNHGLTFGTNNTERMRITAGGNLLVGTTSDNGNKLRVSASSNWTTEIINNNGPSQQLFTLFTYGSTGLGSIQGNGSIVSYFSTSDYRLKEDLQNFDALSKISLIKVYDYKWKNTGLRMDGFMAHELQQVLPYAVSGEKDGEQMQNVDYSKLTPVNTKAIQELYLLVQDQQLQIEQLKNK